MPYVGVNEARRNLLPDAGHLRLAVPADTGFEPAPTADLSLSLKSFDFVMYGSRRNLLIDVKGRRVTSKGKRQPAEHGPSPVPPRASPLRVGQLQTWVTHDDIVSLRTWQTLFGKGFSAAILFCYLCDSQPPAGLFQQIVEFEGRWYALRAVLVDDYAAHMKTRSAKWRTVDVAKAQFEKISHPFGPEWMNGPPAHSLVEPKPDRAIGEEPATTHSPLRSTK